jgi:RNA polymerase sigma-70 factor, ECF subfamily
MSSITATGRHPDSTDGARCAAAASGPVAAEQGPHHTLAESVCVAGAIARLQPAHRAVLQQIYANDRSCAEAANALGVPVGTVKSRLYDGLRHLRAALEQERATRRLADHAA